MEKDRLPAATDPVRTGTERGRRGPVHAARRGSCPDSLRGELGAGVRSLRVLWVQRAAVGAQAGRGSAPSSQARGGAPPGPAATIPPTMAQVVSMSPPAWTVDQKAVS